MPVAASAQTDATSTDRSRSSDQTKRPNIVLFMVDDMGWQDTSLPFWTSRTYYNDRYHTPNMERLARMGVMFTQAYASSISSPSRCSMLTGANVARHRVTNWTFDKNTPTDAPSEDYVLPDWNVNGLSQQPGIERTFYCTSFVQLLHDSGYHTIHCGKAHFGAVDTPGADPVHFGFDVNIAGHAAGGLATYLSEANFGYSADGKSHSRFAIPGLEKYWGTGTFATEALTLEAIDALDRAKQIDKPFFLYMAHYAIHIPIDRDARYFDKYVAAGLTEREAAYAGLIEGMDKSLGDLIDWLEQNDRLDNTIIIFMSDNGGYATGSNWRSDPLYTQNYPLNCGKGSAYEGGIREPMIVFWNGVTKPDTRCDSYVVIEDFFPSILEMADVKDYRTVQTVDGISFVPMLRGTGDTSRGRSLYWNCPNVWGDRGPGIGMTCSVRRGKWKLIYYYDTGRKELFDIASDIGEKHNLADRNRSVVRRLSKDLGRHLRSVGGQRPSVRATGEPCPWPDQVD